MNLSFKFEHLVSISEDCTSVLKGESLKMLTESVAYVMIIMLASSAIDRGFEPRWGKTKDYKLGICCFSAKHAALRRLVGSESE